MRVMHTKPPKERPILMPQVHVPRWMKARVEVAVKKRLRDSSDPNWCKADWMREAFAEKLERELGPMGD